MTNKAQNCEVAGTRWGMALTKHLYVRVKPKGKGFSILNYVRVQVGSYNTTTIRAAFWRRDG